MADTTEPQKTSFLSGLGDIADSLGKAVGGIASAYMAVTGKTGSATPGANGAGTPAAQSDAPAAGAQTSGTLITVLVAGVVIILGLIGIKLAR